MAPSDDRVGHDRVLAGKGRRAQRPQFILSFLFNLVFFPAALLVAYS